MFVWDGSVLVNDADEGVAMPVALTIVSLTVLMLDIGAPEQLLGRFTVKNSQGLGVHTVYRVATDNTM
jgi:hypothetical protein